MIHLGMRSLGMLNLLGLLRAFLEAFNFIGGFFSPERKLRKQIEKENNVIKIQRDIKERHINDALDELFNDKE